MLLTVPDSHRFNNAFVKTKQWRTGCENLDSGANLETKGIFFQAHLLIKRAYICTQNAFTYIIHFGYYSEINIVTLILQIMNMRLSVTYPDTGNKLAEPKSSAPLSPDIRQHASVTNHLMCFKTSEKYVGSSWQIHYFGYFRLQVSKTQVKTASTRKMVISFHMKTKMGSFQGSQLSISRTTSRTQVLSTSLLSSSSEC